MAPINWRTAILVARIRNLSFLGVSSFTLILDLLFSPLISIKADTWQVVSTSFLGIVRIIGKVSVKMPRCWQSILSWHQFSFKSPVAFLWQSCGSSAHEPQPKSRTVDFLTHSGSWATTASCRKAIVMSFV